MLDFGESTKYISSRREEWERLLDLIAMAIGAAAPKIISGWMQVNNRGNMYPGMYNAANNVIAIETGKGWSNQDAIEQQLRREVSNWLTAFIEGDNHSQIYAPRGAQDVFNQLLGCVLANLDTDNYLAIIDKVFYLKK